MIKNILIEKFKKSTSGKNEKAGKAVLDNDLISDFKVSYNEDIINIASNVLSENFFSEYNSKLSIDINTRDLVSSYCSCEDYEKNELKKHNYCCSHLYATFYKFLDYIEENEEIRKLLNKEEKNDIVFKSSTEGSGILNLLLEDNKKEEIKLEVYLNRLGIKNTLTAQFKIGLKGLSSNKLYVVKDINQLLVAYYNKIPINYGKDFTFNLRNQKLNINERRIFDFLQKVKEVELTASAFTRRQDKYIDGKYLRIPEFLIKEFMSIISNNRIYLDEGFFYRPVESEIIFDKPNLKIHLNALSNEYILGIEDGIPEKLNKEGSVFLYGSSIYIPDSKYCYEIAPYLDIFKDKSYISLNIEEENRILSILLPKLYTLSDYVEINKKIKDKIVKEEAEFNFYFDKIRKDVVLTVKVKYGKYEFNIFGDYKGKIIYRDLKKEERILSLLKSLGFDSSNEKFYLLLGDDYLFNFFKSDIAKLQEIGNVYYSENFKIIKKVSGRNIFGEVKPGKYDYFEFKFKVDDISPEEMKNIILAIRDNKKYYKLENGEFLDLEEIEFKNFAKLLEMLSFDNEIIGDTIRFNKNKALYVDDYIKENKLRYIKGKAELAKIQKKVREISKLSFEVPKNLRAELREYQKEGYNYLKAIDYLGFGAILGDEMGLGKTIQAISFILSSLPSKGLVVAPTSLIYNWSNEFEKFAPDIKYLVVNGSKEERQKLLENIEDVDVIITTYNLIKRDLEFYEKIEFDYFFIDEAQNIKNASSQNAEAVKAIKARTKFALTGTPVENSLMELWSIFDFIMPGYLFDKKKFSVRYHKRLNESEEILDELNKLIKPFVLRRYKRDVIRELPEKIEKKLIIPMTEEQAKVYKVYADYAVKLIEKKVKEDELSTSKIEILSYITKLRQLCLDPSVIINDYAGTSGKIDALLEILNQAISEKHKILVFSQFTSVLKNIKVRLELEGIKYSYLDGTVSSEKRIELVDEFNKSDKSVFLISLKAGGTGLNLTSADIVIHFDPWWNPAVEDQATDRAHRFGQRNVVEVIKLIAKDSIEEKIVNLQEEKRKLIEKIIDNNVDISTINTLTEEDILSIFAIS